jgi:hypothetical protein
VGGDGVFHEAVNGLLAARAAAEAGGDSLLAASLAALRLAHIPAGSTDAVACTLHGSRSAFTAAMHVCLGDSCTLDVLRVDTALGPEFCCCIAGEELPCTAQVVVLGSPRIWLRVFLTMALLVCRVGHVLLVILPL